LSQFFEDRPAKRHTEYYDFQLVKFEDFFAHNK